MQFACRVLILFGLIPCFRNASEANKGIMKFPANSRECHFIFCRPDCNKYNHTVIGSSFKVISFERQSTFVPSDSRIAQYWIQDTISCSSSVDSLFKLCIYVFTYVDTYVSASNDAKNYQTINGLDENGQSGGRPSINYGRTDN